MLRGRHYIRWGRGTHCTYYRANWQAVCRHNCRGNNWADRYSRRNCTQCRRGLWKNRRLRTEAAELVAARESFFSTISIPRHVKKRIEKLREPTTMPHHQDRNLSIWRVVPLCTLQGAEPYFSITCIQQGVCRKVVNFKPTLEEKKSYHLFIFAWIMEHNSHVTLFI